MKHLQQMWHRTKLAILLLLAAAMTDRAHAMGLGGYVSGGGGKATGEYEFDSGSELDLDDHFGAAGFGFVLDLDPMGSRSFAYRLDIGLEALRADFEFEDADFGPEFKLVGLVSDHTLSFPLVHEQSVGIWIGPTVRAGHYRGDGDAEFVGIEGDAEVAELGVGGALGVNAHLGSGLTISTTVGVRFSGYAGENEDGSNEDDVEWAGAAGFFRLAFMRTGGS